MLNRLLEFSVRQRVFVLLATLVLIGIGIYSALRLPIDAVPDITNVQVQVNTVVPALAPEEIEKLVTFPIENEMAGIPGLTELRSLSKFGLSQVTLVFEEGTDIYRSRQLVSERLQTVVEDLPAGLTPKLAPISTGLGEIFYYVVEYEANLNRGTLSLAPGFSPVNGGAESPSAASAASRPDETVETVSDIAPQNAGLKPGANENRIPATREAQLMELKLIHDYQIRPRLRSTPGLAEVNSSGGYEKQIVIQPNPDKLKSVGMSFSEIADAIGENVENAGGSVIQLGGEQVAVRAAGRVQTVEEIEQLPLKFGSRATPLRVRDVADVTIGKSVRTGASTYNGEEAVLGAALMLAGENSRLVANAVDAKLKEIQPKLPPGVKIIPVYDRTVLVDRTIRTVETSLFEGAILVVAVLLIMLGNWRAALIVALAIPLSLLFAMTGMVQGRISGNLMSLGAIDFGLIIDGAVVMVENIIRHLGEKQHKLGRRLTPTERAHEVLISAKEVASPMFFGVVIITVVYFPILALTGIEGKMFKPMAITVIFALVGALALSLTLMPALCSYFLGGNIKEEDSFLVKFAKRLYAPTLNYVMHHRWPVSGGAVGLLVLAGFLFTRLGAEFVPQLDEGSFATHMIRTTSIGIDASVDMQKRGEKVLLEKFLEVDYTFSRLGTAEVATDPMGVNVADTYIMFKPPETWRKIDGRTATKDQLANLMAEELGKHVPGEAHLFSQPIEMRFNEILEGTRADIAVKVFGEDFAEIERIASEAREILEKIPGAADVEFDALGKSPLLEIIPKREAMSKYNLHAAELNRVVNTALAGQEVGKLIDGNRRFDIVVRLSEDLREQMDELKRLPVRVDDGGLLTLGQIADFKVSEQVAAITREFGQRRAAIMINLRGRDVESFVLEAQQKIAQIKLPEGYSIEFGGQFKNLQEARARLSIVVPVALALIFVLVFMALHSLRQTLLVYTGIPLAVTGGVFALWARGLPFSISAGIGFIALSGVAVLNGLMMISYFNLLREQGRDVTTSVREGAMTRLRPVLMTALVASLGFVPMAIATGAGAEVQRPLATVVIGGILSSTFLTLVLLPTLYEWLERNR
ncbi:MAG TPA: CusA/CzcA family heavy metal efflux RND transporter [Verrucomicrobiae bacterium]|nr:CusA/CzcA family heavy metal efflux RND transporter [Verrucomicrobiae bacterium]